MALPFFEKVLAETRKMVPITRRVSSFLVFFVCIHVNRKEEEEGETEQQQDAR